MDFEEIDWLVEEEDCDLEQLKTDLSQATCVRDFIKRWLGKFDQSLLVCAGEDDSHNHIYICLIPSVVGEQQGREELAYIYIRRDEVLETLKLFQPVDNYLTASGELDEEKIDADIDRAGFEYHEDLYNLYGPYESAINAALSHATSKTGQALLQALDPKTEDFIQESIPLKDESLLDQPLGWCHLDYRPPGSPGVCGMDLYFPL